MPMEMPQCLVTETVRGRQYTGLWFCPSADIHNFRLLMARQHMTVTGEPEPYDLFVLEKAAAAGGFYAAIYPGGRSVLLQASSREMACQLLRALCYRDLVPMEPPVELKELCLGYVAVATPSHFKTNRSTSLHARHYWSAVCIGGSDSKEAGRRRWHVFPDTGTGELDLTGFPLTGNK